MDLEAVVEAAAQLTGARWAGLVLAETPDRATAVVGDAEWVQELAGSVPVQGSLDGGEPVIHGMDTIVDLPSSRAGPGEATVAALGSWPLVEPNGACQGALFVAHDGPLDMDSVSPVLESLTQAAASILGSATWAELYRDALAHAETGVTIADARLPDYPLVYANRGFLAMTGYRLVEVLGCNCRFLQGEDRDQPGVKELREAVREDREASAELRNYRRDGTLFWNYVRLAPLHDNDGRVTHLVGLQTDVTDLRQLQERNLVAQRDPLTGMANQVALRDELDAALERYQGGGPAPALALVLATDLNEIEELVGVEGGDSLMQQIGDRTASEHPDVAGPYRFSLSELAFVFPAGKEGQLVRRAKELGEEGAQTVYVDDVPLRIEPVVGVGVVTNGAGELDAGEMIRRARVALRAARDRQTEWRIYRTEDEASTEHTTRLLSQVREAITAGELELHYQPKLRLSDGRIHGSEALVRWRKPREGLIPPNQFLPKLEHTRLIRDLSLFVFRKVLEDAKRGVPGPIAMNIGARNLFDDELLDVLVRWIFYSGLSPKRFEVEVTESALMSRPEEAIQRLASLREAGLGVAIDDFGTGQASYAYLQRLPATVLKIDRDFVQGIEDNPRTYALLYSMAQAGNALDLTVVAEGVETAEQARLAGEAGCTLGQGFLWQKALPAAELGEWVKAYSPESAGGGY